CALAFFAGVVLRDLRVPALATALMLLSALVIGVGWPLAMEQFSVKPNAAQKESEYIARNLTATKQAYKIRDNDDVTYEPNWTATPADPVAVNSDSATLSNIRILDPNVIAPAFNQRQFLKNFYGFPAQLAV
ncbi:COG1615 family transporter, partial [Streptomyces sp. SID10244]|nr:COG1615 family transporter [Streptomyces sp. SID10244]